MTDNLMKVDNLEEYPEEDAVVIFEPQTTDLVPTLTTHTQLTAVPTLTPVQSLIPVQVNSLNMAPVQADEAVPGAQVEIDMTADNGNNDENDEPVAKQARTENHDSDVTNGAADDNSIRQLILTVNKAITLRLDSIENKLDSVQHRLCVLEERIDSLYAIAQQNSTSANSGSSRRGAIVIGLPQNGTKTGDQQTNGVSPAAGNNLGSDVTFITLNGQDDYPTGTWLGDENNLEMRVRVPITPSDLLHVNSNCRSAEKMALTLLDYLFDRDTQASSNLSGMGKHGKKQLDPLFIYGIRCHLIHRFKITEEDWSRIKLNIDSKCRTAWRRRQRGMPMDVKAFRGKSSTYTSASGMGDLSGSDESISHDGELHVQQSDIDLRTAVAVAAEGSGQGEVQIIQLTQEHLSEIGPSQSIQILSSAGGQVLGHLQPGDLSLPEGCQVTTVTTDTGEVFQIQHTPTTSSTN